jgi:pimeloyl-ACP methyl ester carboxylesterase
MTLFHDGRAIHYEVIDVGGLNNPWLTMVHGFTHSHAYFSAQVAEFQHDFRLFLLDLRGHGQSISPGPYGIEEYTDDLLVALDGAGIASTHYWGTHTGAAIGLVLALRQPARLSSLVLEGTFLPGFDMPRVGELIGRARSIAQSAGKDAALDDWFAHADWFEYIRAHPGPCRAEKHREMTLSFAGDPWLSQLTPRPVTPVADHLSAIRQPALVYNGENDMPDFKRAAARLMSGLPNVRGENIPNAGGFPGWENPTAVNALVRRFLSEVA